MSDKPLTLKDMLRAHADDLPALDQKPIHAAFDETDTVPKIDESQVGKIRLHRALMKKYGNDYQNNPRAKAALDHYNNEVSYITHYKKVLGARYGR